MRKLIGVLLILAGVVLGVYIDLVVLFVGGIEEIISGVNADPVDGGMIAWGVVRAFVITGLGLFGAFWVFIAPGIFLLSGWTPGFVRRRSFSRF